MALVTETGTGSATSESFCSVADATTYHANRGNAAWALLTTAVMEQSLRKATDFMEGRYRARWKGYKGSATQALTWPRAFVYAEPFYAGAIGAYPFLIASNIVPVEVKNACASLALRASTATLLADQSRTKKSVTIGPITTVYDDYSGQATTFAEIDAMIAIYLKNSGNQIQMVRA
jgi:hypothetical protein